MKIQWLLLAAFLFLPSIVLAQDTSRHVSEEIIVTGVRAGDDVPITKINVPNNTIQERTFGQEMPLFLSTTPSITSYTDAGSYNGYAYFRLRGLDQTRINMTLNGMPLNESEDEGVYFSNFPDFLSNINSIQIQRGVGLASNGVASFAGSINYESQNVFAPDSRKLEVNYGAFNSYRVAASFSNVMDSGHVGMYVRYSQDGSDGYKYNTFNKGGSLFISTAYQGDYGLTKFTGFSGHVQNGMGYLATSLTDINQDPRTNYLTASEQDDFTQHLAQLQDVRITSSNSTLTSSLYYVYLTGHYGVRLDSATLEDFALRSNWLGLMEDFAWTPSESVNTNIGFHANTYGREHTSSIQNIGLYDNTGFKKEVGMFARTTLKYKSVSFFGDVQERNVFFRYQSDPNQPIRMQDKAWSFINPSIGLTVGASENLVAYASIGHTTREPARNDLFQGYDNIDTSNVSEIVDFDKVKPEEVTDIETGLTYSSHRFTTHLSLYNMQFHNEIAPIGKLSYIGLPLRKNVESSYRRGIELDGQCEIERLKFGGNISYIHARINSYTTDYDGVTYNNVSPLLTPEWTGNVFATYQVIGPLNVTLESQGVSKSYLDNTMTDSLTVPSFVIFNGEVSYLIMRSVKLMVRMNNLFDRRYFTSGYVLNGLPAYFVQVPRNIFAKFEVNF